MARENRATARLNAVQALYQMDVAAKGLNEILAEFESHWIGREIEGEQFYEAELDFFRDIVRGVLGGKRFEYDGDTWSADVPALQSDAHTPREVPPVYVAATAPTKGTPTPTYGSQLAGTVARPKILPEL
jgi:hypothetical protein